MTAAIRYAKALYELAEVHKSVAAIAAPAAALNEALADPTVIAALNNPRLAPSDRSALAKSMAKAVNAPALLANTLNLLAANNRLPLLPGVLTSFQSMADESAGLIRAQVQTAVELTPEQQKTLAAKLKTFTGAKEISLTQTTQPSLIGGFRALFAGQVWDTSLSGSLARLKSQLTQTAAK